MNINNSPRKTAILYLANSLASDVIGFASLRLSELADEANNGILNDLNKPETIIFIKAYLDRIVNTYNMQMKSLVDKLEIMQ